MKCKLIVQSLSLGILFSGCLKDKTEVLKPNIVLILADDLGVPQVGCYGSKYYSTPNIDKLSENGLRFTNAYAAASVCSPTRASIVTGKYPARLHLTDYIPGINDKSKPLSIPEWQKYLKLEENSMGEIFKENGYKTAWIGKWHLSCDKKPPKSLKYNPDKQGFDEIFVTYKPRKGKPYKSWQTPEGDSHNVDTITNRSVEFIRNNRKNPFLLVVAHNSIHDPLMEREATIAKYRENGMSGDERNNPVVASMVERLDSGVGEVIRAIKEAKIEENTLLIFYSDNGAKHAYAKQTPFRKGKGWLYEGGIRVPFIASWKGKIKPNTVCDEMVSSIDLLPTFMDISDIKSPEIKDIDGESIYSLLKGEKSIERDKLYWNYPHYHRGSGMKPAAAMRYKNFKLIEWYEQKLLKQEGVYELYDLSKDIGETTNLAEKMPEKLKEMQTMLEQWKKEVGAQSPTIRK